MTETSLTLQRAIDVLDYLATVDEPQTLTRIADAVNLSPAVAHRLLSTLKSRGLVLQEMPTRRYALGWRMMDYANRILSTMSIAPVIEPYLHLLRDRTQETVTYHVASGQARVCVLEAESAQEVRRRVGIGRRVPLYAGASGRAILAFLPEREQERVLAGLPDETRQRVEKLCQLTRESGYAMSQEESAKSVAALAAPVFGQQGEVVGAISISGPLFRWTEDAMRPHVSALLEITKEISQML